MASRVVYKALSLVSLTFAMTCGAPPCFAQEAVKRAVFEDCERALEEFSTQTVEVQASLSIFFARVLALNTQSPSAPEVFAAAPAIPAGGESSGITAPRTQDLVTGALWHNLDAKRELKAKRCALELLRAAGGLAIQALPALATTYSEQPLSDEIAVGLEEAVADVAEKAHKQDMLPSPEHYAALTPILFSQRPLAARVVIQEFVSSALSSVLRTIASTPIEPKNVPSVLDEVDPDGSNTMRAFIEIAASLTPEQLTFLAPLLKLPETSSLTLFINDYIRLAGRPETTQTFARLLGAACLKLGGFAIDATQQTAIAAIHDLLAPGTLSPDQAACVLSSSPAAAKQLPTLLSRDAGPEQSMHAMSVASAKFTTLPHEIKNDVCSRARERALELQMPTSEAALRLLANCVEQKSETIQTAFSVMKNIDNTSDVAKHDALFTAVLELLDVVGLGREPNKFAAYIKPTLKNAIPSQISLRLASQIPLVQAEVTRRALEVPPSPGSLAALQSLNVGKVFPKKHIQALIDLLRYPEVQPIGEDTLRTLGSSSIAPLRKSTLRSTWGGRASALSTLVALNAASKSEMNDLATHLATQEGCSFVTAHPQTLCSLATRNNKDPALRLNIESALQRCVNEMSAQQLSIVASCDKELLLSAADSIASYIKVEGDHERFQVVTQALVNSNLSNSGQVHLLSTLLERGSQASLNSILPFILTLSDPPAETLLAVRAVAERNRDTRPIFLLALKVLASHSFSEYDWAAFIRDAMRTTGRGVVQPDLLAIIAQVPTESVLAEVIPSLESDSPERLVGGALVGAALGARAVPIVSRLWHLRESKIPVVRYSSVLALLQINPLTPDIQMEVRNLLVNRYYPTAGLLPIKWADTVAIVDMDRGSFGDLRKHRLERLLRPTR